MGCCCREGNDGSWSSFSVQIGTPAQNVRLLPGTSATASNTLWVVISEGCPSLPSSSSSSSPSSLFPSTSASSNHCPDLRGGIFTPNQSSTWSTQGLSNGGLYSLYTFEESLLGYGGNAYYGYDSITLGWQGSGLSTLSHQIVAGIATTDFYIGSLGLSPIPMNFTTYNDPQPSMLKTLKNESLIPSLSWAYTAGAYSQDPPVFGSLTLGGYDTTRFAPTSITCTFGADQSRDLLVGIQRITTDIAGFPLLSAGIYVFIDSTVPHVWLPIEACTEFERAFNLTWDNHTELYLLTDDEHDNLISLNANITLRLGPLDTGGELYRHCYALQCL